MQPTVHVFTHIIDNDLNTRIGRFCALQGWVLASLPDGLVDLLLVDDAQAIEPLAIQCPAHTAIVLFAGRDAPTDNHRVLTLSPDVSDAHLLGAITTHLNVGRFQNQFFREDKAEPITKLPHHPELLQSVERFCGEAMGLLVVQVDNAQHLYTNLDPVSKTDLLGAVSDCLQSQLPHKCLVGIHDAACFAVWCPGSPMSQVQRLAHRLCERGRLPLDFKSGQLHFSFSIGHVHEDTMVEPALMWQQAWGYKEQARVDGGNRVVGRRRKDDLGDRIPKALTRDEFSLVLQPQLSIDGARLRGAEALLRWHGFEVGSLAPDHFIPIAERTGQMARIGDWVLERASCASTLWLEHLVSPMLLGINISPQQFKNDAIKTQIARLKSDNWLDPGILELEMSHSNLLHLVDAHRTTLYELRDAGVRIAIDNLGVGLVDTQKLLRCPADTLKIDRSIVNALETDPNARTLVAHICELGERFRLRTIAVGVENEAQRKFLADCGCSDAQGFLFAEPIPLEKFYEFLVERRVADAAEQDDVAGR